MAATVVCGLTFIAGVASAQEVEETHIAFIEANGGGGFQVGETDYLPSGSAVDFQFPVVYSFGVGATAGLMIAPNLAFVVAYQYDRGQTRDGHIPGVLDNVEGRIDYHSALGGLRMWVPVGFGSIRAELAAGVLFPHDTVLQFDYGPALAQLPQAITGTGTRVEHFSVGYGGHAKIGYQMPIYGPLYLAIDLQLQLFQTENAGETTELTNFVADFDATPPTAVTTTIFHGDGGARPSASSVGSGKALLAIGAQF